MKLNIVAFISIHSRKTVLSSKNAVDNCLRKKFASAGPSPAGIFVFSAFAAFFWFLSLLHALFFVPQGLMTRRPTIEDTQSPGTDQNTPLHVHDKVL